MGAECQLGVVKGPPGQHDIVASRDTAPYETACVPAINPWNERRRFWSGALHDNGLRGSFDFGVIRYAIDTLLE